MLRFVALAAAVAALSLFVPVAAEDATPTAVYPDRTECQVQPRSAESIQQFVTAAATPPAASPSALAEPAATPAAAPADSATTEAIGATVRELVACYNAGDYPRLLGLFSDDFLRRWLVLDPPAPETIDFLALPPESEEWVERLPVIQDLQLLPDGRVTAIIGGPTAVADFEDVGRLTCLAPDDDLPARVTFAARDGRWLIDEAVPVPMPLSIEDEGGEVWPLDWRVPVYWGTVVDAVVDLRSAFASLPEDDILICDL